MKLIVSQTQHNKLRQQHKVTITFCDTEQETLQTTQSVTEA